jgi:hypothetical protein
LLAIRREIIPSLVAAEALINESSAECQKVVTKPNNWGRFPEAKSSWKKLSDYQMAAKMTQEEFLVCAANLIKTRIEEEQPTDEPKIEKKKKKGKKNEKNEIEDDGWTENGRWMTKEELHRSLSQAGREAVDQYSLTKEEEAKSRHKKKSKKRRKPSTDDDDDDVDGAD